MHLFDYFFSGSCSGVLYFDLVIFAYPALPIIPQFIHHLYHFFTISNCVLALGVAEAVRGYSSFGSEAN